MAARTGDGIELQRIRQAELPEPEVVDYGPIGDTHWNAEIQVRFNRPMIPLGLAARPEVDPAVIQIDPPIAGKAYWAGPSRLVFDPDDPLPPATSFRVRVTPRRPGSDEAAPELARTWTFTSARPSVRIEPGERAQRRSGRHSDFHWQTPMVLGSNQALDRDVLLEHLHVHAVDSQGDATAVEAEILELEGNYEFRARYEIRPRNRWPAEREIVITVDAKLTSEAGPAPMASEVVFSFRTVEGVFAEKLICAEASHHDGCEFGPVALAFSSPISAGQARHVRVEPEPPGFTAVATDSVDVRDRGEGFAHLMMWGEFKLGVDYRVTVDEALHDIYGQGLAGERSFEFRFTPPDPSFDLDAHDRSLNLAAGSALGIETRYLDELAATVAVLEDHEHERLLDYDFRGLYFPSDLVATSRERIRPTHTGEYGWSSEPLDLARFGAGKPGVFAVELRPTKLSADARDRDRPGERYGVITLTRLGVTVVGAVSGGFVRVAQLSDDTPVAGASVELIDEPGGARTLLGETDASGLLALPSSLELGERSLLRVRKGDDRVLVELAELADVPTERDDSLEPLERVLAELITERPLYLPGESVHVIGWAAVSTPHEFSGLRPLPDKTKVDLRMIDAHGTVIAQRRVVVKAHGKFWAKLDLPEAGALGRFRVIATVLGKEFQHTVLVKDLQPPQFELEATAVQTDVGPGESPQIELWADYLFGGQVPLARVEHRTECRRQTYHPPGLDRAFHLAWGEDDPSPRFADGDIRDPASSSGRVSYSLEPVPTLTGAVHCSHHVDATDASARTVPAEFEFWIHPPLYLAIAGPDDVEAAGDASIEVRAVLPDGSPAAVEHAEVTLTPTTLYDDEQDRRRTKRCRVELVEGEGRCRFAKLGRGYYEVEARAELDGHEYVVYGSWIDVGAPVPSRVQAAKLEDLQVDVGKSSAEVGGSVEVTVSAPWSRGRALLLVGKAGVEQRHELELVDGQAKVTLAISDAWIPAVRIEALAVRPSPTTPSLRRAHVWLDVSDDSRALEVSVRSPSEARTRERIPIDIEVRDADGQPVSGHVSVWAVDEALLAYADVEAPSLLSTFGSRNDIDSTVDVAERYSTLLAPFVPRPDPYAPRRFDPNWQRGAGGLLHTLYGNSSGTTRVGRAQVSGAPPSVTRTRFATTPFFIADAAVDARGHVRVEGQLPDNLTTYRIFALATASLESAKIEARLGMAEARVRVTRPLVVRAAGPRSLRPGDRSEVSVIVDNIAGPAGEVEVTLGLRDADGLASLVGSPKRRVAIAAGGQVRVPFELRAAAIGRVQLEARADLFASGQTKPSERDGVELAIAIEPERAATERVATYGTLPIYSATLGTWRDGIGLLPLALPEDVDPRYGGLSVSLAASQLSELEDALAYLRGYPHGCAEQVASRILPLVSFPQDYPLGTVDRQAEVAAAIERLKTMQVASGGFSPWPEGWAASVPVTAYVASVLRRAQLAGYEVPDDLFLDAARYLDDELDDWLSMRAPTLAQDIEATSMLRTLAELGRPRETAFTTVFERRARLPLFARAQLLIAVLHFGDARYQGSIDALVTELSAFVEETQAGARVVRDGELWTEYWDSDVRTSALVLSGFLLARPGHPIVGKLARGLLDARRGGRWANTQENALALAALADYAGIHEGYRRTYQARVWLDDLILTQIDVESSTHPPEHGFMPMAALLDATSSQDAAELIIEISDWGSVHYRVGLEWTSTTEPPARDAGLALTRVLRDRNGVIGDTQAIELGSTLALEISIEADTLVHDVVVEIPLAAGLEAIDPRGRDSAIHQLGGEHGRWVSHEEHHRDRVLLYVDRLAPGEHHTSVYLRATTVGDYRMPAAQAELAYYPEIYGRTRSRRVVVQP